MSETEGTRAEILGVDNVVFMDLTQAKILYESLKAYKKARPDGDWVAFVAQDEDEYEVDMSFVDFDDYEDDDDA
jgi:ABC-type metal ion transport system substrate-binding protein